MKRRQIIQNLGLGLGVSISLPSLMVTIQACQSGLDKKTSSTIGSFNQQQVDLISSIADIILPETSTPGAMNLNLHLFVAGMIDAIFNDENKSQFFRGLEAFESKCREVNSANFFQCTAKQKEDFLKQQEKISPLVRANIWGNAVGPTSEPDFYRQVKSLILLGYFTSEPIGKQYLHYEPVPGKFIGCLDYTGQKIDAL